MSYTFTVEAQGGELLLIGQSGEVPDGQYTVNGHEDASYRTIAAGHTDLDGATVISASAYGKA